MGEAYFDRSQYLDSVKDNLELASYLTLVYQQWRQW